MPNPETPSSSTETIAQSIKNFSKLKDELLTPDFLTKLKAKTPEERKKYKIGTQLDFEELNMYFNSIKPENSGEKSKIVSIMAPIFDALDNPANRTDPVMAEFLSHLLPPRSFIQEYYNGER